MPFQSNLSDTAARKWFSLPKPSASAKLRLFCLPHAGSGANIFYRWHRSLPESVELCLVHLPGREHRFNERPFERMSSLTRALGRALLPYLDVPVAFLGHSLGALVGFELCRELRREYGFEAAHLFVSGCRAPQSPRIPFNLRAQPQLAGALRRLGLDPNPSYNNAEFLEVLSPALKADFAVYESYSYASEALLDCGISVFGGLKDHNVTHESLKAWQGETTGPFALSMFPGGHYFIQTEESLVLKVLSEQLDALTGVRNDAGSLLTFQDRCA